MTNRKIIFIYVASVASLTLTLIIICALFIPIKFLPVKVPHLLVHTQKGEGIDIIEKISDDLGVEIIINEYYTEDIDIYIFRVDKKNVITLLNTNKYLECESITRITYPWQIKVRNSIFEDSDNNEYKVKRITNFEQTMLSFTAEEVLQHYFRFVNERNHDLLMLTMVNNKSDSEFTNLEYLQILSIIEMGNDNVAQNYIEGTYFAVTSFNVEYQIKYKEKTEKEKNNGAYVRRYILVKETEDSPWLVYCWEINS